MSLNVPGLQALTLHQELDAAKLALQALSSKIARQREASNRWYEDTQKEIETALNRILASNAVVISDDSCSEDEEEEAQQHSQPTSVWFWDADE